MLEYEPFLESSEETVAISARFQDENGEALQEGEACLSTEGICASFPLDEDGEIRVSGLPREGTVDLTLFNGKKREQGHMTICFSLGAVIDASTDESGNGYVTTRDGTDVVALEFTVSETGLRCALRLDEEE